jgi:hypothetical protein
MSRRVITPTKHGAFWNAERDQQLRDLYPYMPASALIREMGWDCTPNNVHQRAHYLGIEKAKIGVPPRLHTVQEYQGYRVITHMMGG